MLLLRLLLMLTRTGVSFSAGAYRRLAASFVPPLLLRIVVASLLPAFRLILTSLSRGWLIGAARSRHGLLISTPKRQQQQQQAAWSWQRSLALHVSPLLCLLALCPPFQIPLALTPAPSLPPSLPLFLPPSFFFLSHSLLTAAVMMLCLHSRAAQGLRQPSVQFRAYPPAPSMHTICFNTSMCSHDSLHLLYTALPHSRDITECEVYGCHSCAFLCR